MFTSLLLLQYHVIFMNSKKYTNKTSNYATHSESSIDGNGNFLTTLPCKGQITTGIFFFSSNQLNATTSGVVGGRTYLRKSCTRCDATTRQRMRYEVKINNQEYFSSCVYQNYSSFIYFINHCNLPNDYIQLLTKIICFQVVVMWYTKLFLYILYSMC